MIIAEGDMPNFDRETGLMHKGYALDIPLGLQEPAFFWHANYGLVEEIREARTKAGIQITDDYLVDVPSEVITEPDPGPEVELTEPPGKRKTKVPQREAKSLTTSWEIWTPAIEAEYKAYKDKLETKAVPGVFPAQLRRYWLGKGLARWATTPTPYRSLVAALRSEGVPGRMINGLAARLYKQHFGKWPGKRGGKKADHEVSELEARIMGIEEMKGYVGE